MPLVTRVDPSFDNISLALSLSLVRSLARSLTLRLAFSLSFVPRIRIADEILLCNKIAYFWKLCFYSYEKRISRVQRQLHTLAILPVPVKRTLVILTLSSSSSIFPLTGSLPARKRTSSVSRLFSFHRKKKRRASFVRSIDSSFLT